MTATYAEAYDEMLALFKAAWDPTGNPALYDNVTGAPPDTQVSWARVTVRHADGQQASLTNHEGKRRWRRDGTLFVQIFSPVGQGLSLSHPLAKIVSDAFEGKTTPSGVWFRNVRINEVGASGAFYQVNVLADFTYDEVK